MRIHSAIKTSLLMDAHESPYKWLTCRLHRKKKKGKFQRKHCFLCSCLLKTMIILVFAFHHHPNFSHQQQAIRNLVTRAICYVSPMVCLFLLLLLLYSQMAVCYGGAELQWICCTHFGLKAKRQ